MMVALQRRQLLEVCVADADGVDDVHKGGSGSVGADSEVERVGSRSVSPSNEVDGEVHGDVFVPHEVVSICVDGVAGGNSGEAITSRAVFAESLESGVPGLDQFGLVVREHIGEDGRVQRRSSVVGLFVKDQVLLILNLCICAAAGGESVQLD